MIKKVYYQRLFSFGQYENERIGFEAEVNDAEKAEAVLGEIYVKVMAVENALEAYRTLHANCYQLNERRQHAQDRVVRASVEIKDMKVKISEIERMLQEGTVEVDEKLRHACDRRSLKTLQDNLKLAEDDLKETREKLESAQRHRDELRERIKQGIFSLEGIDFEQVERYF